MENAYYIKSYELMIDEYDNFIYKPKMVYKNIYLISDNENQLLMISLMVQLAILIKNVTQK